MPGNRELTISNIVRLDKEEMARFGYPTIDRPLEIRRNIAKKLSLSIQRRGNAAADGYSSLAECCPELSPAELRTLREREVEVNLGNNYWAADNGAPQITDQFDYTNGGLRSWYGFVPLDTILQWPRARRVTGDVARAQRRVGVVISTPCKLEPNFSRLVLNLLDYRIDGCSFSFLGYRLDRTHFCEVESLTAYLAQALRSFEVAPYLVPDSPRFPGWGWFPFVRPEKILESLVVKSHDKDIVWSHLPQTRIFEDSRWGRGEFRRRLVRSESNDPYYAERLLRELAGRPECPRTRSGGTDLSGESILTNHLHRRFDPPKFTPIKKNSQGIIIGGGQEIFQEDPIGYHPPASGPHQQLGDSYVMAGASRIQRFMHETATSSVSARRPGWGRFEVQEPNEGRWYAQNIPAWDCPRGDYGEPSLFRFFSLGLAGHPLFMVPSVPERTTALRLNCREFFDSFRSHDNPEIGPPVAFANVWSVLYPETVRHFLCNSMVCPDIAEELKYPATSPGLRVFFSWLDKDDWPVSRLLDTALNGFVGTIGSLSLSLERELGFLDSEKKHNYREKGTEDNFTKTGENWFYFQRSAQKFSPVFDVPFWLPNPGIFPIRRQRAAAIKSKIKLLIFERGTGDISPRRLGTGTKEIFLEKRELSKRYKECLSQIGSRITDRVLSLGKIEMTGRINRFSLVVLLCFLGVEGGFADVFQRCSKIVGLQIVGRGPSGFIREINVSAERPKATNWMASAYLPKRNLEAITAASYLRAYGTSLLGATSMGVLHPGQIHRRVSHVRERCTIWAWASQFFRDVFRDVFREARQEPTDYRQRLPRPISYRRPLTYRIARGMMPIWPGYYKYNQIGSLQQFPLHQERRDLYLIRRWVFWKFLGGERPYPFGPKGFLEPVLDVRKEDIGSPCPPDWKADFQVSRLRMRVVSVPRGRLRSRNAESLVPLPPGVTVISKTPSRPATPGQNFQRLLIRGNGIKKYVRLPAGILCLPGTRSWKKGKAGIVTKMPELTLSNSFFKRFERPERDTRLFRNALVSLYDPSQGLVNFSCSSLNAAGLALVRVDRVGCQFSTRETAALASLHGTAWQLLKAILQGISQPFEIGLHLRGIGFRARCCRGGIELRLGYSHPLFVFLPQDISVEVGKLTEITIKGVDKCRLGRFAATLRSLRLPDGYKGKGIYYRGERVKTRDGKTGKK